MSEATVFQNAIPDGWYDDPATPDMERWWSGAEWTEHVRYANRVQPHPVVSAPALGSPAPRYEAPPQIGAVPEFDDFYVPMRRLEAGAVIDRELGQRRSARAGFIWLVTLLVIGAGVGVALWVFLT